MNSTDDMPGNRTKGCSEMSDLLCIHRSSI